MLYSRVWLMKLQCLLTVLHPLTAPFCTWSTAELWIPFCNTYKHDEGDFIPKSRRWMLFQAVHVKKSMTLIDMLQRLASIEIVPCVITIARRCHSVFSCYENRRSFNNAGLYLYSVSRSSEVLLNRGLFIGTLIPRRDAATFVDTKNDLLCCILLCAETVYSISIVPLFAWSEKFNNGDVCVYD